MSTFQPAIAIHGGAGNLARYAGTGRIEEAQALLSTLIDNLHSMIVKGASAVDTVTEAVTWLEDAGLFHAGKGSSPGTKGYVELDASIMEGRFGEAGAIAMVRNVKNPIQLARVIMDRTPLVMLAGPEAEELAAEHGLPLVGPDYFVPCTRVGAAIADESDARRGTVGAVARDVHGTFAAATSTGGVLNKITGRIGDAPIIGAGTFARNGVGAVSCTGVGEYFIRQAAAYQVIARMELLGESVGAAAGTVMQRINDDHGNGGIIALGPRGEVAMPFNTTGMYRAAIDAWGKRTVGVL